MIEGDREAARLAPRDRALLATILLTGFRHLGEIEAVLKLLMDRPLPRKSGLTPEILILGVGQLLFLEMPAHAVIDLSVRAAKSDRNALHFSGLVNAVLRKVASSGKGILDGLDSPVLNTPPWLWERWCTSYGPERARQIAISHSHRPGLDLSFRTDPAGWADALGGHPLPNGQLRLLPGHSAVPELAGFQDGVWWVQDISSTIPASLLGDIQGWRVIDLCAAPGGKSLQMAAAGANVTAVDVSQGRLQRLRANLARCRLEANVLAEDMFSPAVNGEWDAVLLDAPCSATGTIRRHPELPHLKRQDQLKELAVTQRQMLRKAGTLVKPGGLLVYCTCSLEPEEGEAQVRWFLRWNGDFELVSATLPWLPPEAVSQDGWVRTLPSMTMDGMAGMDGFFASVLRRKA